MFDNKLIKMLCSLPVILLLLYYIPFLGFALIVFRYFVYGRHKVYFIPSTLISLGVVILIPKFVNYVLGFTSLKVPYLGKIVDSSLYGEFLGYSKNLIIFGVVFVIVSYVVNYVVTQFVSGAKGLVNNYVKGQEELVAKEKAKNDLIMQEKREKAQNTGVVICPHCGASNMLSAKTGVCQFCRNPLTQNK